MPDTTEVEKLWGRLFKAFYNIDDRIWGQQAPRLREIARLALALACLCDELPSPKEETGSH